MGFEKKILEEEVKWDKSKTIISKTNKSGTILYVNDIFASTAEYNKLDLIGKPHNIIRHPHMPKSVFKKLWKALNSGENYHAIVKNLTNTGKYYWVITDFVIDKDRAGEIVGYTGRRKAVSEFVINKIEPLYKTLLNIENEKGLEASELYFDEYLKEINKNYEEFVLDLFANNKDSKCKVDQSILDEFLFSEDY